jgi:hypothetical protein
MASFPPIKIIKIIIIIIIIIIKDFVSPAKTNNDRNHFKANLK